MRFEVSSLSFMREEAAKMALLPAHLGIEIFYEDQPDWGPLLERILDGRTGSFSIHSPCRHTDLSADEDDGEVMKLFTEPFDLYRRFGGKHYVVHPHGHVPAGLSEAQREERRRRSLDRLDRLQEACAAAGVSMVVENVPQGREPLFDQARFLDIFRRNPALNCIIDTGHANLDGHSILEMQRALGSRIKAYHINDNMGDRDSHLRLERGTLDWVAFAEGARRYTPEAVMTLEYAHAAMEDYGADAARLETLIGN